MIRIRTQADMLDSRSPMNWNGTDTYSPPLRSVRHVATCLACGRSVEPSNAQEWRRAVQSLVCHWYRGRLLVSELDLSDRGMRPPGIHRGYGWPEPRRGAVI